MRSLLLTLLLATSVFFTAQAQCPPAKTTGVHVVQKGETLFRISKKYNVTVDEVRQWNNLVSDRITVCQELRVRPATTSTGGGTTSPSPTASAYPKQPGTTHIVQRGETVASIARLYGFTEARFRTFNNLKAGQEVAQGAVLKSDDCQCPQLAPATGGPLVAYENSDQLIGPVSMFSQSVPPLQPAGSQPTAAPADGKTQPAKQEPTTYTSAEDLLVDRKDAAQPGAEKTLASPAVTASFKPVVAPYMTAEERAMMDEINLVRTNPAGYIPVIENFKRYIELGQAPGNVEACDELINELKNMRPVSWLEPAECIYQAAKKHGENQRTGGALHHKGEDGSWPWDRVQRACPNLIDGNENFVIGVADARRAVAVMLIDSEIPSRGHRRIMLNKDWSHLACYKIGPVSNVQDNWLQKFGR